MSSQRRQGPPGGGNGGGGGSGSGGDGHGGGAGGRRHGGRGRKRRGRAPLEEGAGIDTNPETIRRLGTTLEQGDYIVFDIETTGGNPEKNGITEIFAIRYSQGEAKDTYYSMVNPGIPIPPIVRRMTGINNQMVKNAPRIDAVMPDFVKFIGSDVLVSHNTIGDMKFVRYFAKQVAGVDLDNFYLCTHLLVEKLVPEAPDKSLKGLAEYFQLAKGELHRAEADAYVTLDLFKVLLGKLKGRSVRRIDEAVRLQGDMESGMRLGWGVSKQAIEVVPPGPGVFYLYDHERKLLFLSSAMQLDREIAKLKQYNQLPRQLLRLVLRSYDIQAQRSPNPYAAMLEECDALQSHAIPFSPVAYHQRHVQALFIAEDPEGLRLGVGPMEEGTRYAFGPVRDRKLIGDILEDIARAIGTKVGRHGLVVPKEMETDLVAFFSGHLATELETVDKRRKSMRLWFKPTDRKQLGARVKAMKMLLGLQRQPPHRSWGSLLDRSGVMIVPDKQTGTWQLHSIVASRPRSVTSIRGEPEQKLKQAGLGRRLVEKINEDLAGVGTAPLSTHDVNRVNATLWWIYNARADGRFIPVHEIDFESGVPQPVERLDAQLPAEEDLQPEV